MMNHSKSGSLKLAVLASGRGSNFAAIQQAIEDGELDAEICILISDKEHAPALIKAEEAEIKALFVDPRSFANKEAYETEIVQQLAPYSIDLIVMAGYMRLLGKVLLSEFRNKIVNIHPALLPSFTGLHAQQQALDYGVRFSGCTVHFVDEGMDTGPIILQAVVPVYTGDTEELLSARILVEEHRIYKEALQLIAAGRIQVEGRKVTITESK